jgi:predicted transcriptional regulator
LEPKVAATSLKLPDELKRRIAQLVSGSDRTAHSFMVEAIEQAAAREELRRRFGEEAALAEAETERSGKVYDAAEAFKYFETRAKGGNARKPRPKSWRRSA